MKAKIEIACFLLAAAAAAAAGCGSGENSGWALGDGDGEGEPAPGEPDLVPVDGDDLAGEPPDAAPDLAPPEIYDTTWDTVCYIGDLTLQYEVSSDVLIVLDRSGSMMGSLDNVIGAVNTIVAAADDKIWFAIMPFPSSIPPNECRMMAPNTECAAPETAAVTLGPSRGPDIAAHLATMRGLGQGVCGSTPTTVTMGKAHAYLDSAATGHRMHVLLATDGVPNCNDALDGATCDCTDTQDVCVSNPNACLDDDLCIDEIEALAAEGVKTYVLGMGASLSAYHDVMTAMAVAGGTGDYYPAEHPDQLLATFEAIMGTIVVSCRFDLDPGEFADPAKVNLYIDGDVDATPRDPGRANGWDYVDEDTIEFYGPACDRILSGDVADVKAVFGCPTVVI